jgi:anti-anti-sigma factor
VQGLSIATVTSDGVCTLTLEGELDLASAPRLNFVIEKALESNVSRLVLDLAAVTFIDSSGLDAFVTAKRRGAGVPVVLHRPSEPSRQLFAIAGFDTESEITE